MKFAYMMTTAIFSMFLCTEALAESSQSVVRVTHGQGIGAPSAQTARKILVDELRKLGVNVLETEADQAGVDRIYVLDLSNLGKKIFVKVEERNSDMKFLSSRHLTALSIEELDVIIPRIAKAIVKKVPMDATARIGNLSMTEGRKWEKLPGEFLWGFGVLTGGGIAQGAGMGYGVDFRMSYEMEFIRVNFELGGTTNFESEDGYFRTGVGASYVPLTGAWSPYFGMSLDYMYMDAGLLDGGGAGAVLQAGFEFFRLNSTRMLVELDLSLPFFQMRGNDSYYDYDTGQYISDTEGQYNVALTGGLTVMW